MSTPLAVTENASAIVRDVARSASAPAAARAAGIGMRRVVQRWLIDLNASRPPKHAETLPGSIPTQYYAQAAESITAPEVAGNTVTISITQVGFRQRLLGGEINPVNATYLTIPGSAISYGTRASEFTNLKFTFVTDDQGYLRPALVAGDATQVTGTASARGKRGAKKPPLTAGDVVFWLVKGVVQQPDPGVLPAPEYIEAGAREGLAAYMRQPRPVYSGGAA